MAGRDTLETILGPLEYAVMDAVWELGECTVREVHNTLKHSRAVAYTTVMTTMTRLAAKDLLRRDTADLAHRYSAAISRDIHARSTVEGVFGWLFAQYPEPAAAFLADVAVDLDADVLARLRDAVAQHRELE